MNWGEIQNVARGMIKRGDVPWQALQPMANDDIVQVLIAQDLETFTTLVPANMPATPFYSAPLPSDFARARSVTKDLGGDLYAVTPKAFRARTCGQDSYTILGGKLWTFTASPVAMVYIQRLAIIEDAEQSNVAMDHYSNVYLYGILKHGAVWATDYDSADRFEAAFDRAVGTANENYIAETLAGGLAPTIPGGIV